MIDNNEIDEKIAFDYEKSVLSNFYKEFDNIVGEDNKKIEAIQKKINDYFVVDYRDRDFIVENKKTIEQYLLDFNREKPYFGHLETECDGEKVNVYIGDNYLPVPLKGLDFVILDWRVPFTTNYYNDTVTEFDVQLRDHSGVEHHKLLLRRKIDIEESVLRGVNTTYSDNVKIGDDVVDEFLLTILKNKRNTYELTNIISTINKNQNAIIRKPLRENFILQGCAGSGKTMVLLHRLSYLLFNNRDIDINNYFVITPNEYFNKSIQELCKSLDVDKINRFSVSAFYMYLIDNLSKNDRETIIKDGKETKEKKIQLKLGDLKSENVLNHELLKYLYSNVFYDYIVNKFNDYINNILKFCIDLNIESHIDSKINRDSFYYSNFEKLLKLVKNKIDNQNENKKELKDRFATFEDKKNNFAQIEQNYLELKKQMDEMFNSLIIEINQQKINSLTTKKASRYESLSQIESRLTNNSIDFVYDYPILTVSDCDDIGSFAEVYNKKMVEYKESRIEYFSFKKEIDMLENEYQLCLINLLSDKAYEELIAIKDILMEYDIKKILTIIKKELKDIYKKYNEKVLSADLYNHQLYIILLICNLYYGKINNISSFVNIDEAQDISLVEYKVIRNVLPNEAVFNLYGDINQSIYNYRSIDNWESINNLITNTIETIMVNYRNTNNITEYCNNKFNMNAIPIGLDGDNVKECSMDSALEIIREIHNNTNKRIAIIYKTGNSNIIDVIKYFNDEEKVVNEIDYSKISIISTEIAKGLEFDAVLVVDKGMNNNDKYVACTRALERLLIAK